MTNTDTTINDTTPLATNLVQAGENFFKSLTGQEMNDNQQKISDGLSKVVDGFIPGLEKMVHFNLEELLDGLAETLNGLAKTLNSTKEEPHVNNAVTETQKD